jgi:hypothetical protein
MALILSGDVRVRVYVPSDRATSHAPVPAPAMNNFPSNADGHKTDCRRAGLETMLTKHAVIESS